MAGLSGLCWSEVGCVWLFACLPVLLVDGALTSCPALATSSKLPLAPSTGSSELSALLTTIEGAHLPLLAAISLVVLVK